MRCGYAHVGICHARWVKWAVVACALAVGQRASADEPVVECPRKEPIKTLGSVAGEARVSLAQALKEAIARNDRKAACAALQAGADPSLPVPPTSRATTAGWAKSKSPAIVLAAGVDDPWFLATLLAHGANPDARCEGAGEEFCYPFVRALLSVNDAHVRLLIKAGMNVRGRDSEGNGMLQVAISFGAFGVAREVLKAGGRPEDSADGGVRFFRSLAREPNLSPEQQREEQAFVRELRALGYKFDDPR